jgi:tetratricopeptide (TPR) repeat protein
MKQIIFLLAFMIAVFTNTLAQTIEPNINSISVPANDWALTLDLTGFKLDKNNISPDSRDILVTQKEKNLTVSVFIEKAAKDGNHLECREFYWTKAQKSPFVKDDIKLSEKGEIALVEYIVKEHQGQTVNFKNVNAYLSYKGYWIDVHISQVNYKEADKKLFNAIVNSLKIEDPKKPNLSESFLFGSRAYYMKSYSYAIKAFEEILVTQKEKVTIDKTIWYLVVDNLGMAYGVSGDLTNAKRVLEYGIKMDPSYPNFYYNLACTYAEMSDLDNALANLELAYQNKDKVLKGEDLPNPKEDSSFSKYLKDKKFVEFLKKYKLK